MPPMRVHGRTCNACFRQIPSDVSLHGQAVLLSLRAREQKLPSKYPSATIITILTKLKFEELRLDKWDVKCRMG
jgi:hypothetical protein